tara:strand:+ start:1148 stop:1369 length:222 start_codon:yes stop_codon:yes gene_type:complete
MIKLLIKLICGDIVYYMIQGGMYMDADSVLLNDIDFIFDYDLLFVTNNRGVKDIFNGFIMTPPKCPIYKLMIG